MICYFDAGTNEIGQPTVTTDIDMASGTVYTFTSLAIRAIGISAVGGDGDVGIKILIYPSPI